MLKIDFIRFCIVGGTGFIINFTILIVLTKFFNTPLFVAQLIGAEVSLASNFTLHHNWTYKKNKVKKSLPSLILQFHASSWPAIIGSSIIVSLAVSILHTNKLEALIISSFVALMWNYAWSKYVIWKDISNTEIEEMVK